LVQTSREFLVLQFIADSELLINQCYAYFSVNQNSSPCEQAIVVHNNPVQARPTPLKGVPNSCNVCLNRRLLFFLFKNIAYWSNLLPIEFVRFSLFHSWEKYYQSKEGENIGGLPF